MSKRVIFFLILQLSFINGFSQKREMNLAEIKSKGKEAIVDIAVKLINEDPGSGDSFDRKQFANVFVRANSEMILIDFFMPIKYVPLETVYYSSVSVWLPDGKVSYGAVANPEDYLTDNEKIAFYKPNRKDTNSIQFVLDAINNSKEVGEIDPDNLEGVDLIIRDKKDFYEVSAYSAFQESWYKISKASGEVYDVGHAHIVQDPYKEEGDVFEEIK